MNTPSKTVAHGYMYDFNGNVVRETRSGSGGQDKYDLTHSYDGLGRLMLTTGLWGYKDHEYVYDSLGNLVRERIHNKWTDYSYNVLNQQVKKVADGKDTYVNTFDARGNFVKSVYEKNKNQSSVDEQYEYDATNKMVKGTNADGEQSHYVYNGFGDLVANEWVIAKNAYGYTGVNAAPTGQVDGVVVCDRHTHTTGQGHQNPSGNGHTTGGTLGAVTPSINSKQAVVHKDYALDYTDPLRRVLMESEGGAGGLTYRYVYGLEKVEVAIFGIPNGAGSVTQYAYDVGNGGAVFTATHPGNNVAVSSMVKLWHHKDRLGSTDYLTDNVAGKVTSYVTYDDWGALTAKAVLKVGVRELDLVQEYTGHPYDMVLGIYYAKARMYDAGDRRFMAVDPVRGSVREPQTMVQYSYCMSNPIIYIDLTGLWNHTVHKAKTIAWAVDAEFTESEAAIIAVACNNVDFVDTTTPLGNNLDYNQSWHYDIVSMRGSYSDSRLRRFVGQAQNALRKLSSNYNGNKEDALREFGKGLHPLQDYYAHMDWNSDTDWSPSLLPGYHTAFIPCEDRETYRIGDQKDVFDKFEYDLVRQTVTFEFSKRNKGVLFTWQEQRNVFIATYVGENGGERLRKTETATKDAMNAFKRVYDGDKNTMGTLQIEHYSSNGIRILTI